ncbi:MAG: hypothetical protein HYR91_07685 [Flavobacteriia bacterium]|nr:hypothetical protein [Flavobacteriia bacterium]
MKKKLLFLTLLLIGFNSYSQDCFKKLEDAFAKRGSLTVADAMHNNVIISFFNQDGTVNCVAGKVRVENGTVVSVFLQFEDNTYELYEKKFYNVKKQAPTINNGITEMIITPDGERFRIIFIEKLKPKHKELKEVALPDDL